MRYPRTIGRGAVFLALILSLSPKRAFPNVAQNLLPRSPNANSAPRAADIAPCHHPLVPTETLPRHAGESVRYRLAIDGISVGTVDFKIERNGTHHGIPVTEYRSLFRLDALLSAFLPIDGRAAVLIPQSSPVPTMAMNTYRLARTYFTERTTFAHDGTQVQSVRSKNGQTKRSQRSFGAPVTDFLAGYYWLRTATPRARACTIVYANQRAYTIWLAPEGTESIATPVGRRSAHRYAVTYASEKGQHAINGTLWLATDASHLPYRVTMSADNTIDATIHLYDPGR